MTVHRKLPQFEVRPETPDQPGPASELVFEYSRFLHAFNELVHDMIDDPGGFELLLSALYERNDRYLELTFQRVLE